jgi:hypothetical protein
LIDSCTTIEIIVTVISCEVILASPRFDPVVATESFKADGSEKATEVKAFKVG